jgi:adenylate cyclase
MDMPAERPLQVGVWRVDGLRNQISCDGSVVTLEPRTMRLLLCLANRPGEVVGMEEILDEVWAGVVVTSESVYQAVGALRRALAGDSRESVYIATVPRRGYRLVAPVSLEEQTPEPARHGIEVPSPAPAIRPKRRLSRTLRWVMVASLGLAVCYVALDKLLAPSHSGNTAVTIAKVSAAGASASVGAPDRIASAGSSIVVLPFADLSQKQNEGYLADGVAEELIVRLAKIRGLRVIARTSSFALKGGNGDVRSIAKKLGVDHILEGSVRRSGNRLRVTTKLVRVSDAETVWAETFDREAGDLFGVQDDIGSAVAAALKLTLVLDDSTPNPRKTLNPEAHIQYLLGREFMRPGTEDGWRRAVAALRKAIALDPGYAAAYAALIDPQTNLYDQTDERRWLDQASVDAEEAISLAPNLADGYAARGNLRLWYQFDWAGARADLEKALSLDPGNADILIPYGYLLASLGRLPDAINVQKRAIAADPLSADGWRILGFFLTASQQYAAASNALAKSLEIRPDGAYAVSDVGQIQLLEGNNAEALNAFRQVTFEPLRLRGVAAAGHAGESERAFAELIRKYQKQDAYQIADAFAWRGDSDKAFAWLDRAFAQRDPGLAYLKWDPLLLRVRGDSRYPSLLKKMHLPE